MASTDLAIPEPRVPELDQNALNAQKLDNQVSELLVSSYDPVVGKTIWQCAQCHFSSKARYTVKQHIETHITDFTHQCPHCERTCKTRNALRTHLMRGHGAYAGSNNTPNGNAAIVTNAEQNADNVQKLDRQIAELLVSSHDPVVGKTIWQCAQCHFSSKSRYTVKQHIETHITDFTHQCPQCERTCKTRNALRTHLMRAHSNPSVPSPMGPDGMMEVQFAEMGSPGSVGSGGQMVPQSPRQPRPRQNRPYDEELERQIRLLLVSNYDPEQGKTTWQCAQCQFSSKLQYTVKQHIETHITNIVHQCSLCPKILKTRNALRAHMSQKHPENISGYQSPPSQVVKSPQWMAYSPAQSPGQSEGGQFVGHQTGVQPPRQPRKRSDGPKVPPTALDIELDRQCGELMVSNYDALTHKTQWTCTACNFTSKIRSTMKEHVETHITGFSHQCPHCVKICKTRNALRGHIIRAHQKHGII